MTEYTKIMGAKYSSAVKMGGIDQNPLVEVSLNSPPEQQSEEKQVGLFALILKQGFYIVLSEKKVVVYFL